MQNTKFFFLYYSIEKNYLCKAVGRSVAVLNFVVFDSEVIEERKVRTTQSIILPNGKISVRV